MLWETVSAGCPADLVMVGQGLLCCGKPLVLGCPANLVMVGQGLLCCGKAVSAVSAGVSILLTWSW